MAPAPHNLTLVRHGETTGQSSIRYYGSTDVPLSDEGETQMQRVAETLRAVRFDRVFSSGLIRTRRAAEIIAPSVAPATAVAEFNEIHFGRWEGLTKQEIAARDPELYAEWRADPMSFRYPEGDHRSELLERVAAGFRRISEEHPPGEWLIVAHRGVIGAILDLTVGAEVRAPLSIDLASVHVVSRTHDGWRPVQLDLRHTD